MRRLVAYLIAGAALVLNPFYACTPDPAFSYDLLEIEGALAGTWRATITHEGTVQSVTFRIEAASARQEHAARGLVPSAAACSKRTLVRSAHACLDVTAVPLVLIALDGSELPMKGTFVVWGKRFDDGGAELELGGVSVRARVHATGTVDNVSASDGARVELVHTPFVDHS